MAENVHVLEQIHSVLRITSTTPDFQPEFPSHELRGISTFTSPVFVLALVIVLVQIVVTYGYTHTKRWSYRALIRNLSFGIGLYSFWTTGNVVYLILPFVLEIVVEYAKYNGYQMDKYIATEYLYSDYFKDIIAENDMFSNLTEGLYDDMFGLDTRDHSEENVHKLEEWSKQFYHECHEKKSPVFVDASGRKHADIRAVKLAGDIRKFATISKQCEIKPGMRILEVGFGSADFMVYIRDHYGISPVGVSISKKQVEFAQSVGFDAHCMNMWDMTPEVLGTFDLIIQCGNMEYTRCSNESMDKYGDYFGIVSRLLKPNGKHFVTCIHAKNGMYDLFDTHDWYNAYFLLMGNDGAYPKGKDALIPYAEKNNLRVVFREERTNDYWITSILFMSAFQYSKEKNYNFTPLGLLNAIVKTIAGPYYLHSYIQLSPYPDNYYLNPWCWQFNPKIREGKYGSYASLEYILFQKSDDSKSSSSSESSTNVSEGQDTEVPV